MPEAFIATQLLREDFAIYRCRPDQDSPRAGFARSAAYGWGVVTPGPHAARVFLRSRTYNDTLIRCAKALAPVSHLTYRFTTAICPHPEHIPNFTKKDVGSAYFAPCEGQQSTGSFSKKRGPVLEQLQFTFIARSFAGCSVQPNSSTRVRACHTIVELPAHLICHGVEHAISPYSCRAMSCKGIQHGPEIPIQHCCGGKVMRSNNFE